MSFNLRSKITKNYAYSVNSHKGIITINNRIPLPYFLLNEFEKRGLFRSMEP